MLANFGGHLLVRLLCTVVSARSFVRFCPIVVALYGSSVLLWLGGGGILDHILWSSIHSNSTASFTVRSKNLLSDMVLVILHSNKCDPFCLLPPSFPRSSFPFSFLPLPPPLFPSLSHLTSSPSSSPLLPSLLPPLLLPPSSSSLLPISLPLSLPLLPPLPHQASSGRLTG